MFATRVATASGKVITFKPVAQADLTPDANAMLVMPMAAMSPLTLARSGVGSSSSISAQNSDDALLDQFSTGQTDGPFSGFTDWLRQTVGLDLADLRLVPAPDQPFVPPADAVVVSQVRQPEGGVWTVLTSTSAPALRTGTEELIDTPKWRAIGGRVSALPAGKDDVTVVAANNITVLATDPLSPLNLRRVAANWFSGNILYFSLAIVFGALLLMFVTSRVLTKIGRPS
jgi:hypothetical protein